MQAKECTCRTFLAGTIQYIVPSFQRPYSWKKERWSTFFEGIMGVYHAKQQTDIYIGAIAIMPIDSTSPDFQKFLLVDGQKRLITVMSLIAALRNYTTQINPALASQISTECLLNEKEVWNYRYKLLPKETNRRAFFNAMEQEKRIDRDEFKAVQFFEEQFQRVGEKIDAAKLYELLLDHFSIIRIELEHDENPYPIFRSLNLGETPEPNIEIQEYNRFADNPQLMALIAGGESQQLEFKEAVSIYSEETREVERHSSTIVRTVAGFMNSTTGGTLLIGVADNETITGINSEYARIDKGKANWDGYHLYIRNMLRARLSIENPFEFYSISKQTIDGRDICRITALPAEAPVYVEKHLYVRSGNQTLDMQGPDLVAYVRKRWPN